MSKQKVISYTHDVDNCIAEGVRFVLPYNPGRVFVTVPTVAEGHHCTFCVARYCNRLCGDLPSCSGVIFIEDSPKAWDEYLKAKLAEE